MVAPWVARGVLFVLSLMAPLLSPDALAMVFTESPFEKADGPLAGAVWTYQCMDWAHYRSGNFTAEIKSVPAMNGSSPYRSGLFQLWSGGLCSSS